VTSFACERRFLLLVPPPPIFALCGQAPLTLVSSECAPISHLLIVPLSFTPRFSPAFNFMNAEVISYSPFLTSVGCRFPPRSGQFKSGLALGPRVPLLRDTFPGKFGCLHPPPRPLGDPSPVLNSRAMQHFAWPARLSSGYSLPSLLPPPPLFLTSCSSSRFLLQWPVSPSSRKYVFDRYFYVTLSAPPPSFASLPLCFFPLHSPNKGA